MSLCLEFDKKYSLKVLLGLADDKSIAKQNEKKIKLSHSTGQNPIAIIKNNHIDIYESIHTNQVQRAEHIKIDDNLINFDFDRHLGISSNRKKQLTDEDIKLKKEELNRVHIKYLSSKQVHER